MSAGVGDHQTSSHLLLLLLPGLVVQPLWSGITSAAGMPLILLLLSLKVLSFCLQALLYEGIEADCPEKLLIPPRWKVGWSFQQPNLVEGVPAHVSGIGGT